MSEDASSENRKVSLAQSDQSQGSRKVTKMLDPISLQAYTARKVSSFRKTSLLLSNLAAQAKSERSEPAPPTLFAVTMQNTYRTEPHPKEKFVASHVEKVIQGILRTYLEDQAYEPRKCALLAQTLTDIIKSRVKEMNMPRYKLICNVIIGQKRHQGVRCTSRCLWNSHLDSSASATYENSTLFASATVYGLYYE